MSRMLKDHEKLVRQPMRTLQVLKIKGVLFHFLFIIIYFYLFPNTQLTYYLQVLLTYYFFFDNHIINLLYGPMV